jgi:hypothetical protein
MRVRNEKKEELCSSYFQLGGRVRFSVEVEVGHGQVCSVDGQERGGEGISGKVERLGFELKSLPIIIGVSAQHSTTAPSFCKGVLVINILLLLAKPDATT